MMQKYTVFIVNLLQDINVIRPLVYLAAREFDTKIAFLVTTNFLELDSQKTWQRELGRVSIDVGGEIFLCDEPAETFRILQNKGGVIIAGSESNLPGHAGAHKIFRIAPPSFLKITLQHGYECVGFLHNRDHNRAYGANVTFAADVICGWCEAPRLTAIAMSERPKLYVSGPAAVIQTSSRASDHPRTSGGLICENLHSVRLRTSGNFGASFMELFFQFCDAMAKQERGITLRPHPGGQSVVKKNIHLPDGIAINNLPMYKVDLKAYDFGISAPSSVIIDMLLAGIPAAVWHDRDGIMDFSNYEGLTRITELEDWLAFARDTVEQRGVLLDRQSRFLEQLAMPTDPKDVYRRFSLLLGNGTAGGAATPARRTAPRPPRRILFLANEVNATLQLCLLKPLAPLIESTEMSVEIITEQDLISEFGSRHSIPEAAAWLDSKIRTFIPEMIVCCRYSGPHPESILATARSLGIPLVYHIDDDLLNVPIDVGEGKFKVHNRPERLHSVDHLLRYADLVYCSNRALKRRLRELGVRSAMIAGEINGSGSIMRPARLRPVAKIGYMGSGSHVRDFEMVLPMLVEYLRRHTEVKFELFSSIPLPDELREFGDRATTLAPVHEYSEFLTKLSSLEWDIGLCPLTQTKFNSVKSNIKWIEYTSIGAAVVATRGMAYDECCSDGCGFLVTSGEWLTALEKLTNDPQERFRMVNRAQQRLEQDFTELRLRDQVLDVFAQAAEIAACRHNPAEIHKIGGAFARTAVPIARLAARSVRD
jgi:glycosyltransferase involved in cell wall biosynthesis